MVRTRSDRIILWPTYFDAGKTRAKGRRVAKRLSVEKPDSETIFNTVRTLGLEASHHPEKSYPGNHWEKEGMVSVEKGMSKTELINRVATVLKEKKR